MPYFEKGSIMASGAHTIVIVYNATYDYILPMAEDLHMQAHSVGLILIWANKGGGKHHSMRLSMDGSGYAPHVCRYITLRYIE